jgi:Protein of unknown function (DUF2911).
MKSLSVAVLFLWILVSGCKENSKTAAENMDAEQQVKNDSIANLTPQRPQPLQQTEEEPGIYAEVDLSPMDMSYYPHKFPQLKMAGSGDSLPVMRVIYSRPHLQGRNLFEDIIKFGENWRLGANEATELDIFQPVTIGDKKLDPGRYTLYAIPKAGYWTIVVNEELDMWGLKQNEAKDLVRVQVPVTYYNPQLEYFTMVFEKADYGANLIIAWDDVVAKLPIKF